MDNECGSNKVISGLKINLSKSELVPVGTVQNVPELASILGCRVSTLPPIWVSLFGQVLKRKLFGIMWWKSWKNG